MAKAWANSIKHLANEDIPMSGKDSKIRTVKLNVTEKNTLFFNVNGMINGGSVFIEIIDPKGQKEGELSLEYRKKSDSKKETRFPDNISGSLNKIMNSPEPGEWTVKIKPKRAKGHIHISVSQLTKPMADE